MIKPVVITFNFFNNLPADLLSAQHNATVTTSQGFLVSQLFGSSYLSSIQQTKAFGPVLLVSGVQEVDDYDIPGLLAFIDRHLSASYPPGRGLALVRVDGPNTQHLLGYGVYPADTLHLFKNHFTLLEFPL